MPLLENCVVKNNTKENFTKEPKITQYKIESKYELPNGIYYKEGEILTLVGESYIE